MKKALGKLQKEITHQNEKLMHIYQLWVTKEQAASFWGRCWNQLGRVILMMKMVVFLDSNLPKQRWFPNHRITQALHGLLLCFLLFIFGSCLKDGEIHQGVLAAICNVHDRLLKGFLLDWSECKAILNTEREHQKEVWFFSKLNLGVVELGHGAILGFVGTRVLK